MRKKAETENYPTLFPEEEREIKGNSLNASNEPRRRRFKPTAYKGKGAEKTSRQKRNEKLWATLYPTPKR